MPVQFLLFPASERSRCAFLGAVVVPGWHLPASTAPAELTAPTAGSVCGRDWEWTNALGLVFTALTWNL